LLQRCRRAGVDAPAVYHVDQQNSTIYMEYIDAITIRDHLHQSTLDEQQGRLQMIIQHALTCLFSGKASILAAVIGQQLAKMHSTDVIHGDLTTSNLMLGNQGSPRIVGE
jgi:TP53 regulating kinase-like protein